MIQSPGFPFQKSQVVHRFKADLLLLPDPPVPCDPYPLVEDLYPVHVSFDHHGKMPIANRHGVVVGIETDQGQGRSRSGGLAASIKDRFR